VSAGRYLLYGIGVTNSAVARALARRGAEAVLVDDTASDRLDDLAAELDVAVHVAPDEGQLAALLSGVEAVVPAPVLGDLHRVIAAATAAGVPICSEFDLAGAWDDRPLLAVTGTNGKTTVALLAAAMLAHSGIANRAVGNLEVPLVEAIDDPEPEWFVVEASSFRLAHTRRFRPEVAVWLNLAPDHLDLHADLESYRTAKERIFADQGTGDTAVIVLDDPVVASATIPEGVRIVGIDSTPASMRHVDALATVIDGRLVVRSAEGLLTDLIAVEDLPRRLPHDITNSLAAAAAALAAGASPAGVTAALGSTAPPPHRVEFVAEVDGVEFIDDSKSTAPHSTLAALAGFDSVVLIAGGRNKGLDLSILGDSSERVRAVIGIGESASAVIAAFPDRPGETAGSMDDAVRLAAAHARPGDTVLLSPGCASFDWYSSYVERGEDFAAAVRQHAGAVRP